MRINPTIKCLDCQNPVSERSKARCRDCDYKFSQDSIKRFWKNVEKKETCWIWKKATYKGYGVFNKGNRKTILTHRFSWELHNGPIPNGKSVCHSCDNPPCVNPSHLWLGTNDENRQDSVSKKRHVFGERVHFAKLKDEYIPGIRKLHKEGISNTIIGIKYNVHRRTIYDVCRNITWRHIP